jgi:hypothetical protein
LDKDVLRNILDGSELVQVLNRIEETAVPVLRENAAMDVFRDVYSGLQTEDDDLQSSDKSRLELTVY